MKDYVKTFTNTSITTEQWREHLFDYFGRQPNAEEYIKKLGQVDWDEVSQSFETRLTVSGSMEMASTSVSTSSTTTRSPSL